MVRISVVKKDATALFDLAATALKRAGANDRMAEAAARHLVRAEEQGLPTHGMSRVPFYCGMLRRGRADGSRAAHGPNGPALA
jgi:(2R)-3-sulfolactate dehydrogenase (NADP+)